VRGGRRLGDPARLRRWLVALGLAVTLSVPVGPLATDPVLPPVRAGDTELLPDLQAARTTTFRIQTTAAGRRLLRFGSQMLNLGAGPMELEGRRSSTSGAWTVRQVIQHTDGAETQEDTEATLVYAGDGHDHWHVRHVMRYHLWSTAGTRRDRKIGFCFFDTTIRDLSLPGAPGTRQYFEANCGTRNSLVSRTGLSVGWGDTYPWDFAYQWIDITGMPGGTYTFRTTIDPHDRFRELNETNNCSWTTVRFTATGTIATVLETGSGCIDDWSETTFAGDVAWLYAEDITRGCDLDLFCTYDPVSRGEMATFLRRALDLPGSTTDHFIDDDGSLHEPAINAIADAGLTAGCGPDRFCPTLQVSRGQMATFLVRALDLEPSVADRFTDDDGSTHEHAIDAIAEAGITVGCGPAIFCPSADVVRGQMAAFLHRAFD
jgi:hypothetical protein